MTKPQVILDDGGKPAFAVIPWREYTRLAMLDVVAGPTDEEIYDDPRSLVRRKTEAGPGPDSRALAPNRTTVAAIEAARRGDVVELGSPADALAELNRDD